MLNVHRPDAMDLIGKYGGKVRKYKRQAPIYAQGDRANELFYILCGRVLVTIVTPCGKEALIAVLQKGNFFGEDCVDLPPLRGSTVTASTDCEVAVLRTSEVVDALNRDLDFTQLFSRFLVQRNKQLKAALVDQMLLSCEKRLARLLLRLASNDQSVETESMDMPINQDMIARMVGTTRPRINKFMNKFRKLGLIEYGNDHLRVHNSLNSILKDQKLGKTRRASA